MAQLNEKEMQLASLISEGCTIPAELTAKLKSLFSGALEIMLEAEMDEHLGYEKHSVLGYNRGNSRNGYNKKTIKRERGEDEISVLTMYAKGMSTRDIKDHLRDIYGIEASASLISRITDKLMPAVAEW